jgi:hypothetical protein
VAAAVAVVVVADAGIVINPNPQICRGGVLNRRRPALFGAQKICAGPDNMLSSALLVWEKPAEFLKTFI